MRIGIELLLAPNVILDPVVGVSADPKMVLVNAPPTTLVCFTVAPRAFVVTIIRVDTGDGETM